MSVNTFVDFLLSKDIPGVNSHKDYKRWVASEKEQKRSEAERLLEGTGYRIVTEDEAEKLKK